jgi:ribokinase
VIVVFGSINVDLVARVASLPPAGVTQAARSFSIHPGGKGANQALAAQRAGGAVALFGAVGRDAFAAPALALLRASGIDMAGVREADAATGLALIHVDDAGENTITLVAGANAMASSAAIDDATLRACTTVLLQFEAPPEQSLALATRAKAHGVRVILNCAPARSVDAGWFDAIDVLIANASEADVVARGSRLPSESRAFVQALASKHGITAIVTLGGEGVVAATAEAAYTCPALDVDVVDTVGAGDAFAGTLATSLDRGKSLPSALAAATAAGSLACTQSGAQEALADAVAIDRAAGSLLRQLRINAR